MSIIPALAKTQLFVDLDSTALHTVQQNSHRLQVGGGAYIVRQGEPALVVYVLLRGYAKIMQVTPDGHQMLIRYVGPEQEFGLIAVLSGFGYLTTVQAVEECELLAWEGELLAQLLERYPRIAFNALRILAQQNQELQRRYQELLTERVEQRLAQAVLRLSAQVGQSTSGGILIKMRLSRSDLAELVGTDVYAVSRIVRRWEQEGLLQTGRKSMLLLRQLDLARIAAGESLSHP